MVTMTLLQLILECHNAVVLDLDDEVVDVSVDGHDGGNGGGDSHQPNLQIQLDCTFQTSFR